MGCMIGAQIANHLSMAMSLYLRSHKREPLVGLNATVGATTAVAAVSLARYGHDHTDGVGILRHRGRVQLGWYLPNLRAEAKGVARAVRRAGMLTSSLIADAYLFGIVALITWHAWACARRGRMLVLDPLNAFWGRRLDLLRVAAIFALRDRGLLAGPERPSRIPC